MAWRWVAARVAVLSLPLGCSLFPDVSSLTDGNDASAPLDATVDSPTADASPSDAAIDVGTDAKADAAADSGTDASTCSCTGLVSAYRFSNANNLGHDFFGNNNFTDVHGSPAQSTTTPSGLSGFSLQVDGSSSVCLDSGFTFDSTQDHTLCWWSRPDTLGDQTNQFAQTCGYDTWTSNSGADYLWRINNCNGGTTIDFDIANVYTANTWVQICQTYAAATKKRTVVIDGKTTTSKFTHTDGAPIVEDPSAAWCIGSYSGGGYWTGLIYLPLWFNRVLTDTEIQQVNATACCLP